MDLMADKPKSMKKQEAAKDVDMKSDEQKLFGDS